MCCFSPVYGFTSALEQYLVIANNTIPAPINNLITTDSSAVSNVIGSLINNQLNINTTTNQSGGGGGCDGLTLPCF